MVPLHKSRPLLSRLIGTGTCLGEGIIVWRQRNAGAEDYSPLPWRLSAAFVSHVREEEALISILAISSLAAVFSFNTRVYRGFKWKGALLGPPTSPSCHSLTQLCADARVTVLLIAENDTAGLRDADRQTCRVLHTFSAVA